MSAFPGRISDSAKKRYYNFSSDGTFDIEKRPLLMKGQRARSEEHRTGSFCIPVNEYCAHFYRKEDKPGSHRAAGREQFGQSLCIERRKPALFSYENDASWKTEIK